MSGDHHLFSESLASQDEFPLRAPDMVEFVTNPPALLTLIAVLD
jgi:hypothetical protein